MNLNSVAQLLMRALLGMQFKPLHLDASTGNVGAVVHTVGTGLSDLVSGGVYEELPDHVYTVKITATNKFQWKKDGGSYSSNVDIDGTDQALDDGVTVQFGSLTGYTINDEFTITGHAGVSIADALALGNMTVNNKGVAATISIYDGDGTDGTLLYTGTTAIWTNGQQLPFGYALQNAKGLYVVLSAVTTFPDLIVGYN